jgi:hypothetical protein
MEFSSILAKSEEFYKYAVKHSDSKKKHIKLYENNSEELERRYKYMMKSKFAI